MLRAVPLWPSAKRMALLRHGCRHRAGAAAEERERPRNVASLRSDVANTPRPPSANNVPTHPVDVHPYPAAMARPPVHAPSAFAILKAEWLRAAASVCASAATSISRV